VRALLVLLAVVVALGAVAGANVILLGYGSERSDRVGRLSPRPSSPAPHRGATISEHVGQGPAGEDLDD
jgi:hypothetical protein